MRGTIAVCEFTSSASSSSLPFDKCYQPIRLIDERRTLSIMLDERNTNTTGVRSRFTRIGMNERSNDCESSMEGTAIFKVRISFHFQRRYSEQIDPLSSLRLLSLSLMYIFRQDNSSWRIMLRIWKDKCLRMYFLWPFYPFWNTGKRIKSWAKCVL